MIINSVNIDSFKEILEYVFPSPFKLYVISIRQEYSEIFKGILSVNKTCRIQTIDKGLDTSARLITLLERYQKKFGYGFLLNASLNVGSLPFVNDPFDASKGMGLDFAVISELIYPLK